MLVFGALGLIFREGLDGWIASLVFLRLRKFVKESKLRRYLVFFRSRCDFERGSFFWCLILFYLLGLKVILFLVKKDINNF